MRALAKAAVEAGLARLGPAAWARRRLAGRVIVLAYHNVVPDELAGYGDASLHITRSQFQRHLDVIDSLADVIPLADATRRAPAARPAVVITFDDAYRGAVTIGLGELELRRWPSVVFVPPGFVPDGTFWWDDLAAAGLLSGAMRERALDQMAGQDAGVRASAPSLAERAAPGVARCATESELRSAVQSGLVALGAHTWSHPNLARLNADELGRELEAPLAWLRERFGAAALPWISYPYGLENVDVRHAAEQAGYAGALLVTGGWVPDPMVDHFAVPRFNVPAGLSANGLALRLSGLLA